MTIIFKDWFYKVVVTAALLASVQNIYAQKTLKQNDTSNAASSLKLYSLAWQQTAAEYRALCYQAFNIARLRIDEIVKDKSNTKPLAIITDLDETILDNSKVIAQTEKTGAQVNPKEWLDWIRKSPVPTVPGATEFLKYVAEKKIAVFYISNRDVKGLQVTINILQRLSLPDADTAHMLFLSKDFSKENRRRTVMNNYDVVMLLGDNLNDFMQIFEEKNIADRLKATDDFKDEWGKKFIVLPNVIYGDWESALYNYENSDSLSETQKATMLKGILKGIKD